MFRNNVIAQYFCNNKVTGQFEYNTLGIQCYNNSFSGHIWFTTFGSQFNYCSFNIPEGSKLEYCEFGSGIGFLNGIPAIRKVKFENNVAWYNSTTYVTNLETVDGKTLAEALTQDHDDQLYVYKAGDKYGVTSFSEMQNPEPVNIPTLVSNPGTLNDNANNYGYVGTLQNIGVTGDIIVVDTITSYVRTGAASPNSTTPVWCRLLKYINNDWTIVYQSIDSKTIGDYESGSEFSFKMERKVNDNLTPNDKIAIVYSSTDDTTDTLNSTQLGFRCIKNKTGGLSDTLNGESTGANNYQTAVSINYLSMANTPINAVTIENAQTITGRKQFNNGLSINGKSLVSSEIDSGELKVLHNNSKKGFIVKTVNGSDSILPLQILSTNGTDAYQYDFPKKNGTVAMLNDIVDNLNSTETNKALSANQGKLLNDNKQDKLQTYTEQPRSHVLITMPSADEDINNASIKVTKTTAAMFSTDNSATVSTGPSGTQLIYSKRDESDSIVHDDRISIGKHDEDDPHTGTHITLRSKSTIEEDGVNSTQASTMSITPEKISMTSPNGEIADVVKEINDKAPKVGYAPDLKVNFAKELVGRGEATEEVIGGIRPTGEISIGDGNATITKIKGESVVWNQLIKSMGRKDDHEGITTYYDADTNEFVLKNLSRTSNYISGSTRGALILAQAIQLNHKYYLYGDNSYKGLGIIAEDGQPQWINTIFEVQKAVTHYFRITYNFDFATYCPVGSEIRFKMYLYDLTQMFGSGNEPKTIEEFETRKPLGVTNEYNEGTIVSYEGSALKSVGFNAYNGTYAKVIGGEEYHATGTTSISFAKELEGDRTPITLNDKGEFIPEEDGYVYAEGKNIVIHLTHSYTPDHVDEYEEDVHVLPDVKSILDANGNKLFPNGLLSAGSVHDEITATKAIKRVGVVDMGKLSWFSNYTSIFTATLPTMRKNTSNVLLIPYEYKGVYVSDIKDVGYIVTGNLVCIQDPSYTDATTFKASLSGVLLYYELAEPIEVDLPEPLNMTYEAWDFGTEELIAEGATTPLNADIVYQFNAVDRIRENSEAIKDKADNTEVQQVKNNQLQLTVKDNGNIVLYNSNGQSQEFMKATPSGDPMHYAYVSAGAEYNATNDFDIKDAPWKGMVDTIEDKATWGLDVVDASKVKKMTIKGVEHNYATENRTSPEGGTYLRYFIVGKGSNGKWVEDETKVLHLPKCWYLNGLGDITNDEMRRIRGINTAFVTVNRGLQDTKARTLVFESDVAEISVSPVSLLSHSLMSIIKPKNGSMSIPSYFSSFLSSSTRYCYILKWNAQTSSNYNPLASTNSRTRVFFLKGITKSLGAISKDISKLSVKYMIDNAAPTSAITITLHHDAYARLKDDADIVAALAAKTLVTLVSA